MRNRLPGLQAAGALVLITLLSAACTPSVSRRSNGDTVDPFPDVVVADVGLDSVADDDFGTPGPGADALKTDVEKPDVGVVVDVPLVPDIPAKPDVPVVPDVPEQPDTPDVADIPDLAEPDVPDVPDEPDVGEPDAPPGPLVYEKLVNVVLVGDLRKVRWHPTGEFALILAEKGVVAHYDATTEALTSLVDLGTQVNDLDVDPSGFFVIGGSDASEAGALWQIEVQDGAVLTQTVTPVVQGIPAAVVRRPNGTDFAVGVDASANHLLLFDPAEGVTQSAAYASGVGLRDLMWADPALYGVDAVITADGVNGANSKTWTPISNLVVGNSWSPGFGNPSSAAWRPGHGYGIVAGGTSNVLYVFDGVWNNAYTPAASNGGVNNGIAWKADGSRALIVGRPTGASIQATVIEHRPLNPWFDPSDLLNVSIPGFGDPPFSGGFNTHLLGVDWRPGACDEGLIVGMDTGTSFNPSFGMLIRFVDATDPACL